MTWDELLATDFCSIPGDPTGASFWGPNAANFGFAIDWCFQQQNGQLPGMLSYLATQGAQRGFQPNDGTPYGIILAAVQNKAAPPTSPPPAVPPPTGSGPAAPTPPGGNPCSSMQVGMIGFMPVSMPQPQYPDCSCLAGIVPAIQSIASAVISAARPVVQQTQSVVDTFTQQVTQSAQQAIQEALQLAQELYGLVQTFYGRQGQIPPTPISVPQYLPGQNILYIPPAPSVVVNVPPPVVAPIPAPPPSSATSTAAAQAEATAAPVVTVETGPATAEATAVAQPAAAPNVNVVLQQSVNVEVPPQPPPEEPPLPPPPPPKPGKVQVAGDLDAALDASKQLGRLASWCQRMAAIRRVLVTFGQSIARVDADGNTVPSLSDATWTNLMKGLEFGKAPTNAFTRAIAAMIASTSLDSWQKVWRPVIRDVYASGDDTLEWVGLAQSYFNALRLLSMSLSQSNGESFTQNLSAGLEALHLGGGSTASGSQSHGWTWGTSAPVVLVQLISLCDLCVKWAAPMGLPATATVLRMWVIGLIDETQAECLVRHNGDVWSVAQLQYETIRTRLSPTESIEAQRRGLIGPQTSDFFIRQQGFADAGERGLLNQLYDEIPGLADQELFGVRRTRDDAWSARMGLDEGFDAWLNSGAERDLDVNGLNLYYSKQYWRAHWQPQALATAIDAFRRLRPGRVPQAIQFTADDLSDNMQLNAVPAWWRARLSYLAYAPLSIRYLAIAYQYGAVSYDELIQRLQDIGYRPEDATIKAQAMRVQKVRKDAHDVGGWNPQRLESLLRDGVITMDFARQVLTSQYFTQDQIIQFESRTQAQFHADQQKEFIAGIKHQMLHGGLNVNQARDQLVKFGIDIGDAVNYVSAWAMLINSSATHEPATTLNRWYQQGLLPVGEFYERLLRLNYTPTDAQRVISVANQALTTAAARQADKDLKAAMKKQAEISKARAAAARAAGRARTAAAKARAEARLAQLKEQEAQATAQFKEAEIEALSTLSGAAAKAPVQEAYEEIKAGEKETVIAAEEAIKEQERAESGA